MGMMHIRTSLLSIKSAGKQNYRNYIYIYTEYYASSYNQDKIFTCTKTKCLAYTKTKLIPKQTSALY